VQRDDWHAFYEDERDRLAAKAGAHLLAFEHVGSTAVPGLAGKPVIDILAGAAALDDAAVIAEQLGALGYVQIPFRTPDGKPSERLFFLRRPLQTPEGVDPSNPGFNIHVVAIGRLEQDEQLLFRDALLGQPALVEEYARLKCEIVSRMTDYREYTPAKSAFVERVLAAARARS
jgi:GrpB-like predicted nucleotidyltransferase (UPF0157 family)